MPVLEYELDHVVQIHEHWNGSQFVTTETTVYSGSVKWGHSPVAKLGDQTIDAYNCKFYFRIPSGAYGYFYPNIKGVWSCDDSSFHMDVRKYNRKNLTYWNEDWSSDGDINEYYYGYNGEWLPQHRTNYGLKFAYIAFRDSDVLSMQQYESDYFVFTSGLGEHEFINEQSDGTWTETDSLTTLADITNLKLLMTVNDIDLIVSPVYPVDVYVRDDKDLIVDWGLSNNYNRSSTYLYQVSNEVVITDKNGDSIAEGVSGSTESQVTFDAEDLDTLAVGKCTVVITVTSNYGTTGTATCEFDLTGETDAPEITSVTQDSYPTISWTSEDQSAWELQISNASGIVYKTGMIAGDDTSYTVPKLLEDGGYSLEMRCINTYGVVTAWSSYFLDLQPTKPDAPENIVVSARADFGISVNCDAMETTGKLLAVRRKDSDSEPEVLGEYNGSFVDYLVGLDDPYEYTIRNYEEGYADGEWIDGTLAYNGVVIRDAQDYSRFIHVWKSEDISLNYIHNDDRSDTLIQCVGRKFPVSELGEWLTTARSFSGYVSDEDFKKLKKMKIESTHVLLQSKEEYFPCHMEFSDQGEYINDGRLVNFQMTRIDGDK